MEQWHFYLETYGCRVNQYESQLIREAWCRQGASEVQDPQEADYILINSCAITSSAERDARNAIYRLKKLAPQARVILTGCAAQFFEQFLPRKNGNADKPDLCIAQHRKLALLNGPLAATSPPDAPIITDFRRARPVVKIQDGCSQNCAYCVVPHTRGKPKSRTREAVLAECRALLEHGFRELVISGINLRQYGWGDPACGDFWSLLTYLDSHLKGQFAGKARLRISSIEPSQLSDKALDALASASLLCPHLHLSLQHASRSLLKKMGRGHYDPETLLRWLAKIRQFWPVMGLGADIIAGFPSETEADLGELQQFIGAARLTYAHVFPFSARPGTAAAQFAAQIPRSEKLRRAGVIRDQVKRLQSGFLRQLLAADTLLVAPDLPRPHGQVRGVCEFYVACECEGIENAPRREFIRARPVGIKGERLLVRPEATGAK